MNKLELKTKRSSAAWVRDLTGRGNVQAAAISELGDLLRQAAWYTIKRTASNGTPLARLQAEKIAEACARESVLVVLKRLPELRPESTFTTWAYKFVVRHALAAIRSHRYLVARAALASEMRVDTKEKQAMNGPKLYVTDNDLGHLRHVVDEAHWHNTHSLDDILRLEAELARRLAVPAEDVPGDVITLNTRVGLADLETGEAFTCTVVLPKDADIAQFKISILAPVGLAILGHRVGDTIEWPVPAGIQRLLVTMVLYQPEAAGIYDMAEG